MVLSFKQQHCPNRIRDTNRTLTRIPLSSNHGPEACWLYSTAEDEGRWTIHWKEQAQRCREKNEWLCPELHARVDNSDPAIHTGTDDIRKGNEAS